MVVRQGVFSFFKCSSRYLSKLWSAKIYFKYSSSCNLECKSFFCIIGGGIMSFLIIWVHVSWFTCCLEWGILNPSFSSLELSCVRFHLKPSIGNVAICGAYQWSKFSPILSAKAVFISSLISNKQLFFVSGTISLQALRCFHKPTTSLFVSLLVSQQLRYNLFGRVFSKLIWGTSWHFLLHLLFQWSIFYSS